MPALASFYDHSSLVSSLTYGNGSTKSYVYDDQQRIKQTYVDNTLTSLYNYDRLGNLVKYSDAKTGITWNHEYDLIGRATRSDASDGRYIGYTYDSFNRLYTVKENVRGYELKTVYDYDDQCNYSEKSGLVTGLTMNNCRQFVYSYDKLNRLTSKTLLKSYGVKTTYSYLEGAGENTTTALIKSVNNDGELLEYAYDQNGNITSVKKNGALLESYEYDALNQLTKVTRGSEVYTYTYDNAGNILSVKKNGTVIKTYGYSDPEWKDLLTSFNGQTITYDAIGNPLTYRDGMTMTWQSGRQLASINKDGLSATFAYDANGHRTQKTVNGVTTNYYWVGDRLQYMATGDDMYVFFYDDKGTPYGVFTLIDGVQEHLFYLYNAQGDVIAIIDDYAERVVNYEYSAWGELLSVTGSKADTVGTLNPFRYRGYCYDTETGLYYLNSRYYDPVTQRFVNGDGLLVTGNDLIGLNLFAYCGNNPIIYSDSTGYGKTYVIYYDDPNSGFYTQAANSLYYNANSKNVCMIGVSTRQDFTDAWNGMNGDIDHIYLYLHGGKGVLHFKGESMGFAEKHTFDELQKKKVSECVHLFSCKGGAGKEGNNVAWMIAKLTNSKVIACTGKVSYMKIFGKYIARMSRDLGSFRTFYYQKTFIFWGKRIAKSKYGHA